MTKKPDKFTAVFWLGFSIFICIESYRLDIGSYHAPGPGFFPFLLGIIMGILSTILLTLSFGEKDVEEHVFNQVKLRNIVVVLAALFIYAFFFTTIGFIVSTFVFVLILIGIVERKNWYIVILVSVTSSLLSYLIFKIWLQSNLPKGMFGL
jgi:putative tricarboxylic transport membrane protein